MQARVPEEGDGMRRVCMGISLAKDRLDTHRPDSTGREEQGLTSGPVRWKDLTSTPIQWRPPERMSLRRKDQVLRRLCISDGLCISKNGLGFAAVTRNTRPANPHPLKTKTKTTKKHPDAL